MLSREQHSEIVPISQLLLKQLYTVPVGHTHLVIFPPTAELLKYTEQFIAEGTEYPDLKHTPGAIEVEVVAGVEATTSRLLPKILHEIFSKGVGFLHFRRSGQYIKPDEHCFNIRVWLIQS